MRRHLLPVLAVGGELFIECDQSNGDEVTGTCITTKQLCAELAKDPLLADLAGGGFEDAGLEFNPALRTFLTKALYIDD